MDDQFERAMLWEISLLNFTFIGIMILGLVFFVLLFLTMKNERGDD
jgi:hypothetical protein